MLSFIHFSLFLIDMLVSAENSDVKGVFMQNVDISNM